SLHDRQPPLIDVADVCIEPVREPFVRRRLQVFERAHAEDLLTDRDAFEGTVQVGADDTVPSHAVAGSIAESREWLDAGRADDRGSSGMNRVRAEAGAA